MKKALIIAHDFPPLNSIGSQRPYSWYKYFPENNIYPIIFAKNWNSDNSDSIKINKSGEIHLIKCEMGFRNNVSKIPFLGIWIRKFLTFFEYILKWKIQKINHTNSLYRSAHNYLKNNKADIIIATGEPWILFKYAAAMSKEFEIPWIADYRDDWIYNHGRLNKGLLDKILKRYEAIYEKKYLKSASGFSTVSEYILNDIEKRINCKNNIIVENGVDLNYLENGTLILNQDDFNIVYTGRFYECSYMQIFKGGFQKFIKSVDNTKIKVFFIGVEKWKCTPYFDVLEIKKEFPNNVEIINTVDIQTATNYQLSATILLNFIAGDPSKGLIGAKAYSYAATKNPTLVIPEISNKNSPFFPNRDIQTIAVNENQVFEFLSGKYFKYLQGISFKTDITEAEINLLSRKSNAQKLSNFILNIC
ncbi:MAG: glycosyltransferase [Crocinitomicaceae bacterium]|nr:glycosyltransferase [Crocinitomicaceae bacterium]